MSVNGVTGGLVRLTLNFLEHYVVSLDHLKSKLSRAQFLLDPKEKLLLVVFKLDHYMVIIFVIFHGLFIINLESLNFKKAISICNNIIVQASSLR
jgi:hypothetical protein